MDLQRVSVALSKEWQITVFENDWAMSRKRSRLESGAPELKPDSSTLEYFQKNFYPLLASVAEGDVPNAEAAFDLPRDVLDIWYLAVWQMNPDWFNYEFTNETRTKVIEFRDGTQVVMTQTRNLPSFMLRLYDLELEAVLNPDPDPEAQLFNTVFYPKMAACTVGEIPTREDARRWPMSEVNKWYEAAQEIEPDWFAALEGVSEEVAKEKAKQEKKKAKLKPGG